MRRNFFEKTPVRPSSAKLFRRVYRGILVGIHTSGYFADNTPTHFRMHPVFVAISPSDYTAVLSATIANKIPFDSDGGGIQARQNL